MAVQPALVVLVSLSLTAHLHPFIEKAGEAFPKPSRKKTPKVRFENSQKIENIEEFQPDPPKIERQSNDKIQSILKIRKSRKKMIEECELPLLST